MQNPKVIINGQQGDQLSCFDRGLLYGDGVFETIAVKQRELQYWEDHLQRLQIGCKTLGLQGLDVALLEKEVKLIVDSESESKFIIKIIITRGVGGRGYKPTLQSLTRIVQKIPWTEHPSSFTDIGVRVTKCDLRLSKQSKLAKIKHLNRLEHVLARGEWEDDYQEGLLCDVDGYIVEATSNNVFFQISDTLITPDLTQCGVAGVMRKKIIEHCHNNDIKIEIRDFNHSELCQIHAMFLCNSIHGIWPVESYCARKLSKTAIIDQLAAEFNS